jgi:hypothetical protein
MATIAQAAGDLDALADALESGRIFNEADRMFGGQFVRSRILDRTARGVDVHGQQFAAYTARYAKRKANAGGRIDQVDLYGIEHHPHMLNAMLARVTASGFEVGFYGDEAVRAEAINEGTDRMVERRFFAPSEQDLIDLHEAMANRASIRMQRSSSLRNLVTAVEE